jgi:uncharacterized membrane protein YhhN
MIAAAIATAVCVAAVGLLVAAERRGDVRGRWRWKPLASAAFVAIPLVSGAAWGGGALAVWIAVGLALGAVGDVALMVESDRGFLAGLVAFLLGHIAYVVGLGAAVPPSTWIAGGMLGAVAGLTVVAAVILRWLWPHLGALRGPVIGYVAVISAMLLGGLAVAAHGAGVGITGAPQVLLTVGAAAFYASDLAVAREKFVARDPLNRTVGLPIYYGAQLAFAWALVLR